MVPQTIDSPSSVARRRAFVATPVRLDAAPVAFSPELASPRGGEGSRFLRFALPWIVALVLWSLVACSPAPSIVALDGDTGAIRWRQDDAGRVAGVFANRIYVEKPPTLCGLDAGTGQVVWQVELQDGARVLENAGDPQHVIAIATDGRVTAYSGNNGKVQREVLVVGVAAGEARRALLVDADLFVQTSSGELLRCVDGAEGQRIAQTLGAVPPVATEHLLVAVLADGSLAAYTRADLLEAWRIAALPAASSLEYRDGAVWLGGQKGALLAVEAESGEIRFALPDAGTEARLATDLARTSAPALVRNGRGLALLDARSGTVTRSIPATERFVAASVLTNTIVVRRESDGAVIGFEPKDGARRYTASPGPSRSVAVVVLDPRAPRVSLLSE